MSVIKDRISMICDGDNHNCWQKEAYSLADMEIMYRYFGETDEKGVESQCL